MCIHCRAAHTTDSRASPAYVDGLFVTLSDVGGHGRTQTLAVTAAATAATVKHAVLVELLNAHLRHTRAHTHTRTHTHAVVSEGHIHI